MTAFLVARNKKSFDGKNVLLKSKCLLDFCGVGVVFVVVSPKSMDSSKMIKWWSGYKFNIFPEASRFLWKPQNTFQKPLWTSIRIRIE